MCVSVCVYKCVYMYVHMMCVCVCVCVCACASFKHSIYIPVPWLNSDLGVFNIGIKHGFSCINIRQVPREVLKTEAGGRGFQHLPRDLANVNELKNIFWY